MKWLRKIWAMFALLLSFVYDLLASNIGVSRIVLSRKTKTNPGIIMMPVEVKKPWAVAMLAYFTSLTPGSTCLHVAEDGSRMYLHLLDARNPDATIAKFRRLYESRIAELER